MMRRDRDVTIIKKHERASVMRKRIVWPNVMTALGLTAGLFVIFKLALMPQSELNYEQFVSCLGLLVIAAILDTLDGAVARAMGMESDFGGFFDSMSDAVTFGVAPSVIILKALSSSSNTEMSLFLLSAAIAYSVAGVLRLVRFSTAVTPPEQKNVFTGLPIPAAAFAVSSFVIFGLFLEKSEKLPCSIEMFGWFSGAALFFIAYMMISRWRFPSLKSLNVKMKSFQLIAILACSTALFFYLFVNNLSQTLFAASWGYVLVSWSIALFRLARGDRALAINDIPDDEGDEEVR